MAYRALYREWRPKDFSHMVGQTAIIETLRNQVNTGRIAHAYLFCGSRGTGKTSTAKILAKAINCLHPVNGDPCGQCENCIRMDQEETLDVIEIDAASNNGVDEMRELRDTVKYPPQFGQYKVYIIDEVHMLSTSAFNALLKTLEEPPAHIVFILATTEPQKLPETILSRCQRFDFGRISVSEIAGRLREAAEGSGAEVSDGALMLIARAADGGMRDALSILDMCLGYRNTINEEMVRSVLGTSDTGFLNSFCDAMAECDAGRLLILIDELMRDGKDPAVFSRDVCRHIRALLIAKLSPDELMKVLDITAEEADELKSQSERFSQSRLTKDLDLFLSLETDMRYSSTPRMALENTCIKCCLHIDEPDVQALTDRMNEMEKQLALLTARISQQPMASREAASAEHTEPEMKKKPETREKAPVSAGQDQRTAEGTTMWNEMLSRIQKTDMAAWSFLNQGSLVRSGGNRFIWQANRKEGEKQFVTALNKPEKREAICRILSEISGTDCEFTAAERDEQTTAHDKNEEAYLDSIYETFGKESVQVVDELK